MIRRMSSSCFTALSLMLLLLPCWTGAFVAQPLLSFQQRQVVAALEMVRCLSFVTSFVVIVINVIIVVVVSV